MPTGTAEVDFGAYPGGSDAEFAITGQGSILSGSIVEAWLHPIDNADRTAGEHLALSELVDVTAYLVVVGTGFTIHIHVRHEMIVGKVSVWWAWA